MTVPVSPASKIGSPCSGDRARNASFVPRGCWRRSLPCLPRACLLQAQASGLVLACLWCLCWPARGQSTAPTPQSPPSQPSQTGSAPQAGSPQTQPSNSPQTPAPPPSQEPPAANNPNYSVSVVPPAAKTSAPGGVTLTPSNSDAVLETELRSLLIGNPLFLRGCYMSDDLRFNERGGLYDSSPRGSFTLSGIQIERLKLTKRELILEGDRYGYRFLGALPGNNPTDDMERIKITPRKKILRIRIEREEVVAAKKEKSEKSPQTAPGAGAQAAGSQAPSSAAPAPEAASAAAPEGSAAASGAGETPQPQQAGGPEKVEAVPAPLKDEPTTDSPEHAVARLKETLGRLFTPALDDRFVSSMPSFWQLYYKNLAAKTDYRPSDPSVLRPSQVDKKARLISALDPPSNEYAQEYGVAGMAVYHVVVGPDGKPGEIVVGQPIGFGLDENAVRTLENATFEPAMKDGRGVPVVLDLIVQFHIYSNMTSGTSKPDKDAKPTLPGPYSVPPKS